MFSLECDGNRWIWCTNQLHMWSLRWDPHHHMPPRVYQLFQKWDDLCHKHPSHLHRRSRTQCRWFDTASVALLIGVADFFLDTIEHLLIHPIGAVIMKADQIVEHCHLVRSKGGQHVVAVMHWVFVGVFVVDSVSMAHPRRVWWDAVPLVELSQRSGLVGRGDYIIISWPRRLYSFSNHLLQ